ncbi:unnamed protein product [Eruca vesicaria subsp. sativa]|uniref:Uncharacterized protein n=1 Tax=Eruca vesicaria subsp. sativa TaxID=29727 RepID=A0ABC8LTG0_ERUVS|nr:unnamed protein product [Eruca vesicaria subsp. sativa]
MVNGRESGEDHREEQLPRVMKDGNKDEAYRAYKERISRGNGEGSSRGGRQQSVRFAINARGLKNLQNREDGHNLSNPQKLVMDGFKGINQSPKVNKEHQDSVVETGVIQGLTLGEKVQDEEDGMKEDIETVDHDPHSALGDASYGGGSTDIGL